MEMQKRGVPHFHVFVSAESECGKLIAANLSGGACEQVQRNGKERTVVRGNLDKWMAQTWLECSEQTDDADARYVHGIGIIERMDSPDAAGRYVAKECAKREQKILPAEYADGLGRWWYLNPELKPRIIARGFVSLDEWPFPKPFSRVWLSDTLGAARRGEWPIARDGEAAGGISAWLRDSGQSVSVEDCDAALVLAISRRNRPGSVVTAGVEARSPSDIAEDYAESVEKMERARNRIAP